MSSLARPVPRSERNRSDPAPFRPLRNVGFLEGLSGADFETLLMESPRYSIPSVNMGVIGVRKEDASDREVSVLGSRLSARVVRHVTDDTTKIVLAPNTTVALKIFYPHTSNSHASRKIARQQIYDVILREVRAFGHRSLSGHPNVMQLLFIGWRMDSPFPVLGMELGQHGSLEHMIKSPGQGLSNQQKKHITVDIALGLYAIY